MVSVQISTDFVDGLRRRLFDFYCFRYPLCAIGQAGPEDDFARRVYPALEETGRPQIFGAMLASLLVAAIDKIEPPPPVCHKGRIRAPQEQFTTVRCFIANDQSSALRSDPVQHERERAVA